MELKRKSIIWSYFRTHAKYHVFISRKMDVLKVTADQISSQTGNKVHEKRLFKSDLGIIMCINNLLLFLA